MNASRLLMLLLMVGIVCLPGCGARPVTGGTKGSLRGGGSPLSDLQVTIHSQQTGAWTPIGFAVSSTDGTFELFSNGAKGSLFLQPGEYRCTLESAGAPLRVPPVYARAETTPLKVLWPTPSQSLDLELPALPMVR
ncbi:hypothetical protein NA78x_004915 [Anatilimnocola sp. NA78]|uniref:hypothetical protein n=1 Tax=Anatilimnocola sp. NA78 TaxID=3415683 RepID=UPI003CE584A5